MQDKAMTGSQFARNDLDFYPTPEWMGEPAMEWVVNNHGSRGIWEPCAGNGALVKTIHAMTLPNARQHNVYTDIKEYPDFLYKPLFAGTEDFLTSTRDWSNGVIMTNPPYGDIAEQIVRKALKLTHPHGVVVMLLRSEWDKAVSRHDLFEKKSPFRVEISLSPRPIWVPGSKSGARHSYSWFIWDWQWVGSEANKLYYLLRDTKRNRAYGDV